MESTVSVCYSALLLKGIHKLLPRTIAAAASAALRCSSFTFTADMVRFGGEMISLLPTRGGLTRRGKVAEVEKQKRRKARVKVMQMQTWLRKAMTLTNCHFRTSAREKFPSLLHFHPAAQQS